MTPKFQAKWLTALVVAFGLMAVSHAAEPVVAPVPVPIDIDGLRWKMRTRVEVEKMLENKEPTPVSAKPLNILFVGGKIWYPVGSHDHIWWMLKWSKMFSTVPGVTVDTAMTWPTPKQIAAADVIAFNQCGGWDANRSQAIDAHLAKGGGLIYLHYSVNCGKTERESFAQRIGLAGQTKWSEGYLSISFNQPGGGTGKNHPIGRNFEDMQLLDESYWGMTGDLSKINVIATTNADGKPQPQMWTYEPVVANAKEQGRVFVTVLGHHAWSFNDPLFRILLLRGFAWVSKEPVDRFNELATRGLTVLDSESAPLAPKLVQKIGATAGMNIGNLNSLANIIHDDCLTVGNGWGWINTFKRDPKAGTLTCVEGINVTQTLKKIDPANTGKCGQPRGVFGAKNVLYLITDARNNADMLWLRMDTETGKSTALGSQKCETGCLAMSNNKKWLYLITQVPPAIQVYKIQDDGTPVKGDTITGKGLGSLGAANVPSQSGDTPFIFSPDGLFFYNFSDADKSIGWCKVSDDGSLSYVDSCDVKDTLCISDVKVWNANEPVSMRISPDGKHLYTLTTNGSIGLFQRDLTTGAITYVSNAVKEKFEVKPLSLVFTPDGKTAYFVGKGPAIWWWSRNPESGMLALQGRVALSVGTVSSGLLFDDVLGTIYLIEQSSVQVFSTH